MPKQKLTDLFIRNYDTPNKRVEIYDTSRGSEGLVLRVTSTGHKSFAYRYRFGKKVKRYTIGKFPAVSLTKARKQVKELSYQVSSGIDPSELKKERKATPARQTFEDLVKEYKKVHLQTLRETTIQEHTRIIDRELLPILGKKPIDEIKNTEIISLLDKKAIKGGKKTMANRIRTRLHSIFEFGIHRGIAKVNPVSGTKPYQKGERKRERYYTEKEIRLLWKAFEQQSEPSQSILKMLLVTGQRKSETMKMKWSDISGNVWTIPAELSKSKRSHDVPLSDMALDVLKKMKTLNGDKPFVFASPVLNDKPITEIKRSIKNVREYSTQEEVDFKVNDFKIHDLRRTAATHMAKLNIDRTVLGKILNHKGLSGDGLVTAIYDRHEYLDEKRDALNKWADYLKTIMSSEVEEST